MVYSPLFNDKFTVITKTKLDFELPSKFTNIYGSDEEVSFKIQNYQIQNDEAFSGHFLADDLKSNLVRYLARYSRFPLDRDLIYTTEVLHDGVDSECSINRGFIFCSIWALPFILENYRTNNSLYGGIVSHRFRIKVEPLIPIYI
jgi:hypothetical protein